MAKVLVVDDEAQVLAVMCEAVAAGGHQALRALTPSAAIRLGLEHAPDVLLTDLNLKDRALDGIDVLERLRHAQPHLIGSA
jgi:CheY-like chemotaxis protein